MRYRFPHNDNPKREYFSTCSTEQWGFESYMDHFQGQDAKTLLSDYVEALQWVLSHNIRNEDRAHVGRLIKQSKKAQKEKTKNVASGGVVFKAQQITIGDNNKVTNNFKLPIKRDNSCLDDAKDDNTNQWAENNLNQDQAARQDDQDQQENGTDDDDEKVDQVLSLWDGWIKYIESYVNDKPENIFRPELHNVLWCGQGVHKREGVPDALFQGIQDVNNSSRKRSEKVFDGLKTYIDSVLDAPTLNDMDDAIAGTKASDISSAHRNKFYFVKSIFTAIAENIYSGMIDPRTSEMAWNDSIIWPILKACVRYMQWQNQKVAFIPGEEALNSMANPNSTSSEPIYRADGVVRAIKLNDLEVCLLETSKALGKAGRPKKSFDHHKGMFGLLSMLKRVAETYDYATYKELGLLKLIFLHGHGDSIRAWTLQSPQQNVYLMEKVLKIHIPSAFNKKANELFSFIDSCWDLLHHMVGTFEALESLQAAHDSMMREYRYGGSSKKHHPKLSTLVDPKIVRMSERRHATVVTDDGPASSPIQMMDDNFSADSDE